MAQTFSFPTRPTAGGVRIHSTAIVDSAAQLGADVEIGPFCVVEAGARIGDRTRLIASVHIAGGVDIGGDSELHVGAVIGQRAQIRDWQEAGGGTRIGPRSVIREYVTINRASREDGETAIGADALLMSCCHVAHDCRLGDGVTIANGALLAGWVSLGDHAFVSGNVVIHQFVRIGRLAMIGGHARVGKDVPPFMLVGGNSKVCGVNVVGMRRAQMPPDARRAVRRAYGVLYRSGLTVSHAVGELQAQSGEPYVAELLTFIAGSTRGLCAPRARRTARRDPDDADL
jgi:UDP-N-acetylglucosamine acyltransferase